MAEWLFDHSGSARLIIDEDVVRDVRGKAIGWVNGHRLYSLRGHHIGWFEDGVAFDNDNFVVAFSASSDAAIPSRPALKETPLLPHMPKVPTRPYFSVPAPRPISNGWSQKDAVDYMRT